jgi:hypothetical protein
MTMTRSRWAAIGAAVAVTLGAGGIGLVNATNPAGAVTFVPISPCRLADTRPNPADSGLGGRDTPLGAGEVFTLNARADLGQCTEIPDTATGISMNATSVNPTAPTFVTIWPADETRPLASSLNALPGEPPTPNGVATELSDTGEFSIYNLAGTVDIVIDINGYYVDHDHDDRYYTEDEVDGLMPAFGFIAADGTPSPNTVGLAVDGVDGTGVGVYALTLAGGLQFDPALHAVTVTPACPGFIASAAAGVAGVLVITITDDEGTPTDCGFSFTVTALPTPAPSTTTTTTSTTTTTTVAP